MPRWFVIDFDLLNDLYESTEDKGLKDDMDKIFQQGSCPSCGGPMVIDNKMIEPFCGSWLYMTGGCKPMPNPIQGRKLE